MRHKTIRAGLLLGGLASVFAVYVAMRPLGIHVSDSYAWVNTVEKDAYGFFFHPHHLLYIALACRWTEAVKFAIPCADVWASMAAMSAVFGCAGLAAVYLTLRILGARTAGACAGVSLVAFGFGYWFFSSDAEVYVVSASCALWSFYFLARFLTYGRAAVIFWAGVASGFAALFHQTGIFIFIPSLVIIVMAGRQVNRTALAGLFTLGFSAIVAPPYLACAWAVLPELTPAAFVRWIFLFAGEGYGGFSVSQTTRAPFGLARGFVGGQMALDTMRGVATPGLLVWCGLALAVAAACSLAMLTFHAARTVRSVPRPARVLSVALAAGFAIYAGFGAYFDPVNFEWWTIPVVLLTVLISIPALASPSPRTKLAFLAAALLFGANAVLDFSWRREPRHDLVQVAAGQVLSMSATDDVIVCPSYLGVVLWREAPGRRIFCPEESVRMRGVDGARLDFDALRETDAGVRRAIVVGVEADAAVREFAGRLQDSEPAGCGQVVGYVEFFNGGRRIVETVGRVPVTAFDAPCRRIASR